MDEVAFLRAALCRAVERSSIRAVAARTGLSHGAVHSIVTGSASLYGKTIHKLRTWYLKAWATGEDGLTPDAAAYLLAQVLAAVPPGERNCAAAELLRAIETIHDSHRAPRPAWLRAVRDGLFVEPGPERAKTAV